LALLIHISVQREEDKMRRLSGMSDEQISREIKALEGKGFTGRTNLWLHKLNCEQTNRLTPSQIKQRIHERERQGKSTGKLRAAARRRGIRIY
jgi:hypothetical protein